MTALRQVFPSFYHADSLWILYVPVLLGLLQILVLTRIIDIERTRGHDRDLCVDEVRKEMAPGIYLCSWVFVIGLILGGVCELLSIIPSMGLWKEGLFISLCCALILPLSTHVFFPLFYLESEETLSRIGFRIYRLWRRR